MLQTITVTYASDVTPMVLRPYLTSYVNLCWVIGQFIAAGVLRGFLDREDQWAYRVPFAIQWVRSPWIALDTTLILLTSSVRFGLRSFWSVSFLLPKALGGWFAMADSTRHGKPF